MLSPARSAWCTKKLNSTGTLIQRTTTEAPQGHMYYIGLDVHKKTISYCVKDASGQVHQEGQPSDRCGHAVSRNAASTVDYVSTNRRSCGRWWIYSREAALG